MTTRYGTGEIYGYDFSQLTPERIRELSSAGFKTQECPFRSSEKGGLSLRCNKKGGVCSLRRLVKEDCGNVTASGEPVTTCPNRFLESNVVMSWVGDILLDTSSPSVISELPFLMGDSVHEGEEEPDPVGKIDKVLVNTVSDSLRWCALEMQAVYFSGKSMENDFKEMRSWSGPGLPFPSVQRRPDFRSSGPKRLMPQLQIKVPTISRWGKKMAVVIDKAFWESLSEMREVKDLSNCEIVWFVVSYSAGSNGRFTLQKHEAHFTTLSHAVEGLTGGVPMSLHRFESAIRARLPQT